MKAGPALPIPVWLVAGFLITQQRSKQTHPQLLSALTLPVPLSVLQCLLGSLSDSRSLDKISVVWGKKKTKPTHTHTLEHKAIEGAEEWHHLPEANRNSMFAFKYLWEKALFIEKASWGDSFQTERNKLSASELSDFVPWDFSSLEVAQAS